MGKFHAAALVLIGLVSFPGLVQADYIGPSPLVPPPDGVYLSPDQVHTIYSGPGLLIVLQDIQHYGFTNIVRMPSGPDTIETFDSIVDGQASINMGPLFPVSLMGPVMVQLFGYSSMPGDLGTFQTEMLALNLVGGGVMIRESPTLQSQGQTQITDIGGGQFRINSFFDVFTELSIDGGQSWIPSQGPTRVNLHNAVPEPSTLALFGTALAALPWLRRRAFRVSKPA